MIWRSSQSGIGLFEICSSKSSLDIIVFTGDNDDADDDCGDKSMLVALLNSSEDAKSGSEFSVDDDESNLLGDVTSVSESWLLVFEPGIE